MSARSKMPDRSCMGVPHRILLSPGSLELGKFAGWRISPLGMIELSEVKGLTL